MTGVRRGYLFFVYIISVTARYCVDMLVYYEPSGHLGEAIAGEKEIKGWSRARKSALIATQNPLWADLSPSLCSQGRLPGLVPTG